jgi:glycosyltransferase involved in cell wall biosynthesis
VPVPDATAPAPAATTFIVVPAYNEGRRIARTLAGLVRFQPNVVVVDDGSRDDTAEAALRHDVTVLRHVINCGQGAALQTGIDYALAQGADYIVTFDADGQHSADDIDALVEPLRTDRADVALGSRFLGRTEGITAARWLILKAGVLFTRVFSRIRVTDTHNGLRAVSRHAARRIRITQNRMAHASEILDEIRRHGLRHVEVPVTIHYSTETFAKGQSSWNAVKIATEFLLGRVIS